MGLTGSIPTLEVEQYDSSRLEAVFNQCFQEGYRTRLYGGAEEPLYQPATASDSYHALRYRADYFASALHEIAHWCIAGRQRRLLSDFGYWYTPEGRSSDQQRAFEDVLQQAGSWQETGLPTRSAIFYQALCLEYGTALNNEQLRFDLKELQ